MSKIASFAKVELDLENARKVNPGFLLDGLKKECTAAAQSLHDHLLGQLCDHGVLPEHHRPKGEQLWTP